MSETVKLRWMAKACFTAAADWLGLWLSSSGAIVAAGAGRVLLALVLVGLAVTAGWRVLRRRAGAEPPTARLSMPAAGTAPAEFAPLMGLTQRVRRVGVGLAVAVALPAAFQFALLPLLNRLAQATPCAAWAGVPGAWWVSGLIFIGLPLGLGGLVVPLVLRRGLRILRDGQVPPRGERVWRATRIRRGAWARFVGLVHGLAPVPFLALAMWGMLQVADFARAVDEAHAPGPSRMGASPVCR